MSEFKNGKYGVKSTLKPPPYTPCVLTLSLVLRDPRLLVQRQPWRTHYAPGDSEGPWGESERPQNKREGSWNSVNSYPTYLSFRESPNPTS